MLDEEVIVKNAKNGNERLLIVNVLLMVLVPAFIFGGNTVLATGVFIALGIIAPINVFCYKKVWIDAPPHVTLFYTLALAPYFASFLIACIGLFNPTLTSTFVGAREYFGLDIASDTLITSASDGIMSTIAPELVTIACLACALSIYFITDSRYIIRRTLFFCSLGATVLAVFGFFYAFITSIRGFENLPRIGINPFSTFPDAAQWCAFALIWMGASITIAIYSAQRFRIFTYVYSLRFFSILMALILFGSIIFCGSPLHALLGMILGAIGFMVLFMDTVPTKKNMNRHWTSKYISARHKKVMVMIPALSYAVISITMFAGATMLSMDSATNPNEMLLVDSENTNSISLPERRALLIDSADLVQLKPEFGWGTASFPNVFAFYQSSDLGETSWASPNSDLIHKIIENGFVGIVLSVITPMCFFVMWLGRWDFSSSGLMMFITVGLFLILSLIDYPFQCIAAQSSFWVLLMSAFRWENAEVR